MGRMDRLKDKSQDMEPDGDIIGDLSCDAWKRFKNTYSFELDGRKVAYLVVEASADAIFYSGLPIDDVYYALLAKIVPEKAAELQDLYPPEPGDTREEYLAAISVDMLELVVKERYPRVLSEERIRDAFLPDVEASLTFSPPSRPIPFRLGTVTL